jgi:hypothetical protein
MPLGSPWDQQEVRLLRDEGDHAVVGVAVHAPPEDDPDDRFALAFETSDHRTLRLRLPGDQLVALGETLLRLAQARRCLRQDGPPPG